MRKRFNCGQTQSCFTLLLSQKCGFVLISFIVSAALTFFFWHNNERPAYYSEGAKWYLDKGWATAKNAYAKRMWVGNCTVPLRRKRAQNLMNVGSTDCPTVVYRAREFASLLPETGFDCVPAASYAPGTYQHRASTQLARSDFRCIDLPQTNTVPSKRSVVKEELRRLSNHSESSDCQRFQRALLLDPEGWGSLSYISNWFHGQNNFMFPLFSAIYSTYGSLDTLMQDEWVFVHRGFQHIEKIREIFDLQFVGGRVIDLNNIDDENGCLAFDQLLVVTKDELYRATPYYKAQPSLIPYVQSFVNHTWASSALSLNMATLQRDASHDFCNENPPVPFNVTIINRQLDRTLELPPEADLRKLLGPKYTVHIFYAEYVCPEQIINTMAQSDVLVGVHGGALTWGLFLPMGRAVIQILPYPLCHWSSALEYNNMGMYRSLSVHNYCLYKADTHFKVPAAKKYDPLRDEDNLMDINPVGQAALNWIESARVRPSDLATHLKIVVDQMCMMQRLSSLRSSG